MQVDKDTHSKVKSPWGRRRATKGRGQAVSTARDQQWPGPGAAYGEARAGGQAGARSQRRCAQNLCKVGKTSQDVTQLTSQNVLANRASSLTGEMIEPLVGICIWFYM